MASRYCDGTGNAGSVASRGRARPIARTVGIRIFPGTATPNTAARVLVFRPFYEPNTTPVYTATITCRLMTYKLDCIELGEISGLTVKVAERIIGRACDPDRWLYRIVAGKYAGRYIPATRCVTFKRI